jgi:hypothetical protein
MGLAVLALLSQLSHPEAQPPKPLLPAREAAGPASLSSAESSEQRFHVPGKMEEADRLRLRSTRGAARPASTANASAAAFTSTASCRKQPPQAWNKNVLEQVTRIREVLSVKPGQSQQLCCDWMGEQDSDVAPPQDKQASLGPLDFVNVIAFSAVGLEYAPQTRFRTLFLNELGVSSFLAHYDDGEKWYKSQGWYAALVKYSTAYKTTSKTRYLSNALKNRYNDVFIFFSHVWLLDEDVSLPPPHHVSGFVSIAVRLQAGLAQPTVDAATWSVVKPNSECAVRETDVVETQMPLMRTQAAIDVFTHLLPDELESDWGLDATWCRYLEAKYGSTHPACIVANSGGFRKSRPASSNYTRLEAELCMRAGRQSLVAEMRTRRCVDQDARRARIATLSGVPIVDAQLWPHAEDQSDAAEADEVADTAAAAAPLAPAAEPAAEAKHLPTVRRDEAEGAAPAAAAAAAAAAATATATATAPAASAAAAVPATGGGGVAHGVGGGVGGSAAPSAPATRFDTSLERSQERQQQQQPQPQQPQQPQQQQPQQPQPQPQRQKQQRQQQQQQQAGWGSEFARGVGQSGQQAITSAAASAAAAAAPSAPTLILPSAALHQRVADAVNWRETPVAAWADRLDLAGDPVVDLAATAPVDPTPALRASDYDHDPTVGLRGAEVRSAQAAARSDLGGPRPVRMYVYDIAALNLSSMCFGEIDYDSPMSDFMYETHLEAELRAVS